MEKSTILNLKIEPKAEAKLQQRKPQDYSMLSQEQVDAEMKKGLADINAGRVTPAKQVRANMQKQFSSSKSI